ncbi:hypothetical protein XINFAN_02006 [Pseudogemmobacter humi]|uniref:Uncharacterized protein n=1 Tax=Pseudogemmobacter humi TaxID=2483812 RepID=A0A3P5XH83_9RHOB|nr:hypothetical protein XINFAN_02006 [Pseudogemmobacter humi]
MAASASIGASAFAAVNAIRGAAAVAHPQQPRLKASPGGRAGIAKARSPVSRSQRKCSPGSTRASGKAGSLAQSDAQTLAAPIAHQDAGGDYPRARHRGRLVTCGLAAAPEAAQMEPGLVLMTGAGIAAPSGAPVRSPGSSVDDLIGWLAKSSHGSPPAAPVAALDAERDRQEVGDKIDQYLIATQWVALQIGRSRVGSFSALKYPRRRQPTPGPGASCPVIASPGRFAAGPATVRRRASRRG